MRKGTIYRVNTSLDDIPADLELKNIEWGLLLAMDGKHTVAQLQYAFDLSAEEIHEAVKALMKTGMVEEVNVNLSGYLRAQSTIDKDKPKTIDKFLSGAAMGLHEVPAEVGQEDADPDTAVATDGSQSEQKDDSREPGRSAGAASFSASASSFRPLANPKESLESMSKRLSLRKVIQFILDRAIDENSGQLDVYRVFVPIDTTLLKRNGINSLHFDDDHIIEDKELCEALEGSMKNTLGVQCPRDAYF